MTEEKKTAKKTPKKPTEHKAKKTLFVNDSKVKKGEKFTCTEAELKAIKANGGV